MSRPTTRLSDQLKQLQLRQAELAGEMVEEVAAFEAGDINDLQPGDSEDAAACKLKPLLQLEVQLLQQLSSGDIPSNPQELLGQLLQPDHGLIAPTTDPMALMYAFMARPIMAKAATMSAQEVAGIMATTIKGLSILLHKLACSNPWSKPLMLTQVAAAWDRYLHCILSLVLLGRQDVVEQAHCINLDTMAIEPAEAAQHQAVQASALVPCLRLSEQQQELISAAMSLYYELLASVHKERQDLDIQMTAAGQHSSSTDASMAGGSTSSSSSSQQMDSLPGRQEQLQVHQALIDRLNLLLHKEYRLRMTAMSWFIGSLSYEQLSKMAVLSWPYAPRHLFIATEIMQQYERLIKQRQLLQL